MDKDETATIRTGALSLLLQIARIAGVAPLRFQKLRDGYSISVSHFQLVYSFIVITAFNVIGLIAIYLNLKQKILVDFQARSTTVLIVSEHMACIVTCAMAYMGATRMKNMINHINMLDKIIPVFDLFKIRAKNKIGYDHTKQDIKVIWISCVIIILNFIFTLLETMIITLRASNYDIAVILFAIHYLQYNILIILKIQVVVINFEVYKVVLELNTRLRNIFAIPDQLTPANAQAINNGVRTITQCYLLVCDIVNSINNTDGLHIFLVYTCFAIFSVFDGYQIILAFNNPDAQLVDIIMQCGWCIMIIIRFTFFVEPFHRVSTQIGEMKVLLAQLMYHVTPLGKEISVDLDLMIKQVLLNVPIYSPTGISTLNRSQITLIFNVTITFLVFIVQLQL